MMIRTWANLISPTDPTDHKQAITHQQRSTTVTAITEPTEVTEVTATVEAPAGDTTAIVAAADLLRAVKTVKGAISTKSTLPVLHNVLLDSPEPGKLDVTATNLEVGITVHLGALVFEPFALTVPHRLFMDTLPKSGDVILTIQERTRILNMEESDGSITNYKGIAAKEFPIIPRNIAWELAAVLPNALLQRAVREVVPYASTDDSRPQLAGVLVRFSDDGAVMFAAADGFRLGRLTGQCMPNPEMTPCEYIVPASAFALLSVLADQGDCVWMHISPGRNQVTFTAGSVEVTSRLIEGNYVDINRVIPQDWATRIVADVDSLTAAVKKVAPFVKDSAQIMRVAITGDGALTLSGDAAEMGNRTVPVPTVDVQGEGAANGVALNLRFVLDLLAPYKGQCVTLNLKTYQSPATFRIGDDFLAVIMPMYLPNR